MLQEAEAPHFDDKMRNVEMTELGHDAVFVCHLTGRPLPNVSEHTLLLNMYCYYYIIHTDFLHRNYVYVYVPEFLIHKNYYLDFLFETFLF